MKPSSSLLFAGRAGILVGVLAGILAAGCSPGERTPQDNFDLMRKMTYNSVTEGAGTYREGGTEEYTITGTGVVVGNRYLTVDHVVSKYEKVTRFAMGPSRTPYREKTEKTLARARRPANTPAGDRQQQGTGYRGVQNSGGTLRAGLQ